MFTDCYTWEKILLRDFTGKELDNKFPSIQQLCVEFRKSITFAQLTFMEQKSHAKYVNQPATRASQKKKILFSTSQESNP